ncbi:hypothetical protein ACFLU6_14245 [Acidobacteriota bacterium]
MKRMTRITWLSPMSAVRNEAMEYWRNGKMTLAFTRGLLASSFVLLVYLFLWCILIPQSPIPAFEMFVALVMSVPLLLLLAGIGTILPQPYLYSVSSWGISVNMGRIRLRWSTIAAWNIEIDLAQNARTLLIQLIDRDPIALFLPASNVVDKIRAIFDGRLPEDPTLTSDILPTKPRVFSHTSGVIIYGLCLLWGLAVALTMALLWRYEIAEIRPLLILFAVNLVVGLPGYTFAYRGWRSNRKELSISIRMGYAVNILSTMIAILFFPLFIIAFFLQSLLETANGV